MRDNRPVTTDPPPPSTSEALRESVWRALLALTTSADVDDRCDAARCLALFAGTDEVDRRLLLLVGDDETKNVTLATVDALAKRADRIGWRLIAQAYAFATESFVRDYIIDAVENVLAWDWVTPEDGLHELQACVTDEQSAIATAAAAILDEIRVPTADDPA